MQRPARAQPQRPEPERKGQSAKPSPPAASRAATADYDLGIRGPAQPRILAPATARRELPNGLRVVLSESRHLPIVSGWLLVRAAGMTVALSVTAMPLAVMAGLGIALLRLYGPWAVGRPAAVYVELVRGTPLVLQLYVIFFLLPEIGLSIHAFWAAVIGLAINYSAYEAEIYRAGLQAIPRGQMEAALALGMSRNLALRRVIVPQATRLVIILGNGHGRFSIPFAGAPCNGGLLRESPFLAGLRSV